MGSPWCLLPWVVLASMTACGADADSGSSDSSCAYAVNFEDVHYLGTGDYIDSNAPGPTVGKKLAEAELLACDDGGDENGVDVEGDVQGVYTVVGVETRWAIAFGTGNRAMILVRADDEIPSDVHRKLERR